MNTYRECIRSRAIFGIMFFAVFVVGIATLFATVTIGDRNLVVLDFGLFAVSLCTTLYAVLSGSSLLEKELTRRTIMTVLSKAVSRTDFLVGKYLGILAACGVLLLCLTATLMVYLIALSGTFPAALLHAVVYMLLECTIVCALTIFFSAFVSTPILAGCFTVGVWMTGRSAEYLLYFAREGEGGGVLGAVLELLYAIIPHLHSFVIADQVVQGIALPLAHTGWGAIYAIAYSALLLTLGSLTFSRRNFT